MAVQAAAAVAAEAAGDREAVVVVSTQSLPSLAVKHRLAVMEEVVFVDYIEVDEVVRYLGGILFGGVLVLWD